MTNVDTLEMQLGDGSSPNSLRRALRQQRDAIERAIAAFDRTGRAFAVTLKWAGPHAAAVSVQDTCEFLKSLLVGLGPEPQRLQSVGALRVRGQDEPHLTLTLERQDAESDPVGMLLLEHTISGDAATSRTSETVADIRRTLKDHAMVHADSEYVVEVDVPVLANVPPRDALLSGLALARSAVAALPAEPPNLPNVQELRVCRHDADGATRLRIWRLGFMKVAGRTRMV